LANHSKSKHRVVQAKLLENNAEDYREYLKGDREQILADMQATAPNYAASMTRKEAETRSDKVCWHAESAGPMPSSADRMETDFNLGAQAGKR